MDEDTHISLDGRTYTWNGEQWYDERFIQPPDAIIHKLNALLENKTSMRPLWRMSSSDLVRQGMIAKNSKQYQRAESYFREVLKREPGNKYAINPLAALKREMGKSHEALELTKSPSTTSHGDVAVSRASALTDLGQYKEALDVIRGIPQYWSNTLAMNVYKRIQRGSPRLFKSVDPDIREHEMARVERMKYETATKVVYAKNRSKPYSRPAVDREWRTRLRSDPDGYRWEYCPSHPFCDKDGYVRQHRLVIEEFLGQLLPTGWVIHHIDEDKMNNALENLMPMPSSSLHNALHGSQNSNHAAARQLFNQLKNNLILIKKNRVDLHEKRKEELGEFFNKLLGSPWGTLLVSDDDSSMQLAISFLLITETSHKLCDKMRRALEGAPTEYQHDINRIVTRCFILMEDTPAE